MVVKHEEWERNKQSLNPDEVFSCCGVGRAEKKGMFAQHGRGLRFIARPVAVKEVDGGNNPKTWRF